jgi:hypothetical protein
MSELFLIFAGIGIGYFIGYRVASSKAVDTVIKMCNWD